jgi:UDP-N-acetylglucosamine transferase subunit ALG13
MPRHDYLEVMKASSLVICHDGAGSIIDALMLEKPVVVMPRIKKYGEHIYDSKADLARKLEEEGYLQLVFSEDDLNEAIQMARTKTFKKYVSDKGRLISKLSMYLEDLS